MTHDIPDDRNIAEALQEWDSSISFGEGTNTYKLLSALFEPLETIDDNLDEVYHDQHIDSADGDALEQFGNLVQTQRRTGESDANYRARIKAAFRTGNIGTTFDEFAQFCASVLSTNIDNLNFAQNLAANEATITVGADQQVYDQVDLTANTVKDILEDGVPAGHAVEIVAGGTFRLRNAGDSDTPEQGLSGDDVDGGTLAATLA
jgi:hypothetical protein